MEVKIKEAIDQKIEEMRVEEENPWRIYGTCKRIISDYETQELKRWFSSEIYSEYIKYITDKLEI